MFLQHWWYAVTGSCSVSRRSRTMGWCLSSTGQSCGVSCARTRWECWCERAAGVLLQVEKCKLAMREAVKECEESGGDRAIPEEHIDEDGEIDEKHIFCGRCHDPESYEAIIPLRPGILTLKL